MRKAIETQFKLYEDCVCRIHAVGASGPFVFTERTDHVTMRHNGKRVSARMSGVFELDARGKITAWRDYYDPVPVYRQIGLSEQELYATAE
ncbi:limonene-1,2-epoxide hydrolase family protein [Sphingobium baderi]|uniref:limonene-1,2-epoxide hydrolase family protein n=1 Tax=Sphingobium baderi TaxID=1332080 RepID=UPI0009EC3EF0|nr:limonene-1,2-epoxide hydrolase family protein [Sphingobium baderi]